MFTIVMRPPSDHTPPPDVVKNIWDLLNPEMLPNDQKHVICSGELFFDLLKSPEAFEKTTYFRLVRMTEGEVVIGTTIVYFSVTKLINYDWSYFFNVLGRVSIEQIQSCRSQGCEQHCLNGNSIWWQESGNYSDIHLVIENWGDNEQLVQWIWDSWQNSYRTGNRDHDHMIKLYPYFKANWRFR